MRILVLGVGNPLLGDDSLGLHVARNVKEKIYGKSLKVKVDVEEISLDWLTIAEKMLGYDKVILVDTIIVDEEKLVGEIFKFNLEEDYEKYSYSPTLHNFNFPLAFKIVKKFSSEKMPEKIVVILVGIKRPEKFTEKLSLKIKNMIPKLVEIVLDEILNVDGVNGFGLFKGEK